MEKFGKFVLWLLFLVVSILISGFITMYFWKWFIVPVFDMDILSFSKAIGLSMFIMLFKKGYSQNGKNEKEDFKEKVKSCVGTIVYSLMVLLLGFVVHLFI